MRHRVQIVACGHDTFGADQTADLEDQGEEGREIDKAQRAQKEPAWNQAIRRAMLRVQQPADGGCRSPVHERSALYTGRELRFSVGMDLQRRLRTCDFCQFLRVIQSLIVARNYSPPLDRATTVSV